MRSCPDDLAVLTFLEMREHLQRCASCALLVARCREGPSAQSLPGHGVKPDGPAATVVETLPAED